MSLPIISLTPSCSQVRKSILSTCAPIVVEKSSSIRAPIIIIGGPDSLYHPLHQGCLKWLCLGGNAKECIPKDKVDRSQTDPSYLEKDYQQTGTIFIPSSIEDTVIFIHPRLALKNNLSTRGARENDQIAEGGKDIGVQGGQRDFVVLNTAEDAIESNPLSVSSSLLPKRFNASSTTSSSTSNLVARNALRSVHGIVHLSVRKSERENDHDPAELFKVVSFIDEMMRIPRGLAIAIPLSAQVTSPSLLQSLSSTTTTEGKEVEISTPLMKNPRLKQANSIVESFPIVQAFALQDVGPGGFLTMHHPIIDNGSEIVNAIRHLDPHGLKRLLRSSLPALLRCWRLALASPGSIRDPLRRLTKFTEVTFAEPLSSFYEHTIGDSGLREEGNHPLFDVCIRGKQVLALTRGGGALRVPFVTSNTSSSSQLNLCEEVRKEAVVSLKMSGASTKPLPLGQGSRLLKSLRLSPSSSSSSAMRAFSIEALEREQNAAINENVTAVDYSSTEPESLIIPSLYSVLEFDDAASGLRCCRSVLLRTNRPPLPVPSSSSSVVDSDNTEDRLLTALSEESIERPYSALASGLRQGIAVALEKASILEKKGVIQDALAVIAENVKTSILASLSSSYNSPDVTSDLSSRLFIGVDAMDATGETVATWNGEEESSSSETTLHRSPLISTSFISRRHIFYAKAALFVDDSSILERFGFEERRGRGGRGRAVCFGDSFVLVSSNDLSFTASSNIIKNEGDEGNLFYQSPFSGKEQLYPSVIQRKILNLNSSSSEKSPSLSSSGLNTLRVAGRILTAEVPVTSSVAVSGRAAATAINAINRVIEEHITYDTYLKARLLKAAREAAESEASESAIGSYSSYRGVGKGRSGGGGAAGGGGGGGGDYTSTSTNNESSASSASDSLPSVSSSAPLKPPPALPLYMTIQTLGHCLPCRTFNNVNVIVSHSTPFLTNSNIIEMTGMSLRIFEGGICLNHPTRGPNVISMECHVHSLHLIEGSSVAADALLRMPERNSNVFKKSQAAWLDAIESNNMSQSIANPTLSTGTASSSAGQSSTDAATETVLEMARSLALVSAPGYSDVISSEGNSLTSSISSVGSSVDGVNAALIAPPDILLLRIRAPKEMTEEELCALGLPLAMNGSGNGDVSFRGTMQFVWIAILLPPDQNELRSNILGELSEWRTRINYGLQKNDQGKEGEYVDEEDVKRANNYSLPLSILLPYTRLSPYFSCFSSAWEDQNFIEFAIQADIAEVRRTDKCLQQLQQEPSQVSSMTELKHDGSTLPTLPVIIIAGSVGGGPVALANAIGKCLDGLPIVSTVVSENGSIIPDGNNNLVVVDCSSCKVNDSKNIVNNITRKLMLLRNDTMTASTAILLVAPATCDLTAFASIIDQSVISNVLEVPELSSQVRQLKIIGCLNVVHVGAGAPPLTVDLRSVTPMTGVLEGLMFSTDVVILQAAGAGATSHSIQVDTDLYIALCKRGSSMTNQLSSASTFGSTAPFHALYNISKLPCSFAPSTTLSTFVFTLSLGTAQSLLSNAIRNWSRPRSKAFRRIYHSNILSFPAYPSSVAHIYSRRQMEGAGATMGDDEEGVASLLRVDSYLPCASSSSITVTSKCTVDEQPLRDFLASLVSGSIDRASAALLGSTGISRLTQSVGLTDRSLANKEGERVAILESMPSLKIDFGIGGGIIPQTACYVTGLVKIAIHEKDTPSDDSNLAHEGKDNLDAATGITSFSSNHCKLALVTASPTLGVRISSLSSPSSSFLSEDTSSTDLTITGSGSLADSRVISSLTEQLLLCRPALPSLLIERERLDDRERQNCERAHATDFLPNDITFDGTSYFDMNGVSIPGHPLSEAICILYSSRRIALVRLWNNLLRRCQIAREREEHSESAIFSFPTRTDIDWLEREENRARNLFVVAAGGSKTLPDTEDYSYLLGQLEQKDDPWWRQLSRAREWILARNERAPLKVSFS